MKTFFTGQLPQNTYIVTKFHPEHTYILPKSVTLCFPFELKTNYYQVVIDTADTTQFEWTFIPGAKAWPSSEAAGQSIITTPASITAINLQPNGIIWNMYLAGMTIPPIHKESSVNWQIQLNTQYWFNITNLQNRESSFFLRFTYHGTGRTVIE